MSASIAVTTGISKGTTYWIERPVMRIGSDGCDLCLPSAELAAHAITLEFRGGVYHAHNKTSGTVHLHRQPLAAGQSGVWKAGEELVLAPDVVLVLEVSGNPAPSPRPTADPLLFADEAEAKPVPTESTEDESDSATQPPKRIMELVVIVICLIGGALLLLRGQLTKPAASKQPTVSFSKLVTDLQPKYPRLVHRLQYTRAALVRGQLASALEGYQALADDLTTRTETSPNAADPQLTDALHYVIDQLDRLQ